MAVALLVGSSAIGLLLLLLDAPLWAYYLASLVGLPVLIPLLRWKQRLDYASAEETIDPAGLHEESLQQILGRQFAGLASLSVRRVEFVELGVGLLFASAVIAAVVVSTRSESASSALVPILVAVSIVVAVSALAFYARLQRPPEMPWQRIVAPGEGGWVVRTEDRVSSRHRTKAEAQRAAKKHLQDEGGGELVFEGKDGRIRRKDTVLGSGGTEAHSSRR